MGANLDLIRATYEGASEDNGRNLVAALAPDATWTEAEGFPYAGTYVGIDAIIAGVFHRLATEWIGYSAKVHTYLEDGDRVAAFGVYSGTYKATGKSMTASFAHLYRVSDGKIATMVQYVDSHLVMQALEN
ncbi:nuclear transport factor 2 family protein [Neorhizobium galegae]|uniref:Ketosteroid isomerase-like protein n=1 Tax=Neorhizobium galegae bv. orientalis str. HAMBI 540 TaxID=1028800 RepID=A0A068SZ42_NEOGA|nr:nuclear transport factor 2 family protein [Neorhizobium galegae]MCQ1852849.1 nuclear transport factor 2 family protein [Neorhizobium galegae]CDN51101.1 Ketosteroid isomerase-like protein [Neorhizobium galegae bv. orientalis str. HAMBI 540]CDZ44204.1 Ketosteroid isomerase-like protein [Neorhizobium galegae bv. orientalis]